MRSARPVAGLFVGPPVHVGGTFGLCRVEPPGGATQASFGFLGGAGGIRTLDRPLQAYNGLANRRLQPLGHSSMSADMPDARASRKRQIQITPKLFTAAALRLRSSRAAHVLHRALKRIFPGSAVPGKGRPRRKTPDLRGVSLCLSRIACKSREIDSRSPAGRFDPSRVPVPTLRPSAMFGRTP